MVQTTQLLMDTEALARSCGLYRWARGMSVSDLAEAAGVTPLRLIDLEIKHVDELTDDERHRLVDLVSGVEVC